MYLISYAKDNEYNNRSWIVNSIVEQHPLEWVLSENQNAHKNKSTAGIQASTYTLINFWELSEEQYDAMKQEYEYGKYVEIQKN